MTRLREQPAPRPWLGVYAAKSRRQAPCEPPCLPGVRRRQNGEHRERNRHRRETDGQWERLHGTPPFRCGGVTASVFTWDTAFAALHDRGAGEAAGPRRVGLPTVADITARCATMRHRLRHNA